MKILCLINPKAGGGLGLTLKDSLLRLKQQGKFEAEITDINFVDKVQHLAWRNFDAVYVAGGDGTVSFVLQKLANTTVKIGIFALGTANDLAREMGVLSHLKVQEPQHLLNVFAQMKTTDATLWSAAFGNDYETSIVFSNYASIGYDALVVASFAEWRSKQSPSSAGIFTVWKNRSAYFFCGMNFLLRFLDCNAITITADGDKIERRGRVRSIFFANIRSCMGLGRSNSASFVSDEKIEILSLPSLFNYLGMLLKLKIKFLAPKLLRSCTKVDLQGLKDEIVLQVDGEAYNIKSAGNLRITPFGKVKLLHA